MTFKIGLATTFHDPAIAIIDPDGMVVFAEATERYLQFKRAPNCEPDTVPRMESLLRRYIPKGAEVTIATSWSAEFTGFLDQPAPFPAGSLSLARELGMAGKILLGSDFPNIPYPYARQLAGLARLDLGADWLRAVCWDNPVAMFGLPEAVGGG